METAGDNKSLWEFALALYRSPGVEETVLDLQDRAGANANLMLWACWLQQRGIELTPSLLEGAESAIASWDRMVVQDLRELRRYLKGQEANQPLVKALRQQVKDAELLAERQCISILSALDLPEPRRAHKNNAELYLDYLGRPELAKVLPKAMTGAHH